MDGRSPARTAPRAAPPPPAAGPIEAQLAQLHAQFDLLKAQVRQAQQLSSLGTAAATIAHEVNNLLTPIVAYSQMALGSNDPELQKTALAVTVKNANLLIAMTGRVLEISAAKPAKREPIAVRTAIDEAVASMCRDFSKDGIRFHVTADPAVVVWADPLQLQQVFFNLFLNAREAMAGTHSGRLSVTAHREGDQVLIEVRNSGEPIPAELLPHVFEPFQTSKPAVRNGRSRCGGLGLALVKDLVEENGGSISVRSDAPSGTAFAMALPSAQDDAIAASMEPSRQRPVPDR